MNPGAALRTRAGLVLACPNKTHCELILHLDEQGFNVLQPMVKGWLDLDEFSECTKPEWPGVTSMGPISDQI